jgi:hypothetical protein
MRHSFKSPRHIHMITLPSGRVIKSDYDIPDNEELGSFDVAGMAISEGTKAVKSGKAGSQAKETLEAASKGAAMGAAAGSIVPGVGTVIGAGVGALIGGVSSLTGDKDAKDFCGKTIKGSADKIVALAMKGKGAKGVLNYLIEENIKRGILPPGATIEDLKSGKVAPMCGVKEPAKAAVSAPVSAPIDSASNLDVSAIKDAISAGSLSKSDIQDALSQVLSSINEKKQAKQILLESISKNTNKNLSSIKKTLLRNALSNEATSEHNKRMKEDAIIRRSDSKQNIMLNRLSAIETALKIKKAKGKALAEAFGIPESYV